MQPDEYRSIASLDIKSRKISRRRFLALGASVAGVLAVRNYVTSHDAAAITGNFPGLRFFPGIGVRSKYMTWSGDASFAQRVYDAFAAPREDRYFPTPRRYWFIVEKKFFWRELLVDENKAPSSHAESRNPAWSNYKWNHTDVIKNMVSAPCMVDKKAKLGLLIAATATSTPDPVPAWMKAKGLTWSDGDGRVHVRLDKEDGWRYIADLYVAILQKYGRNHRIANVVMGEYYPGPRDECPSDFSFEAFLANAREIWKDVIANAPRDKNGKRATIAQVNPMLNDGIVTSSDVANLKLGISQSDPYIFTDSCGEPGDVLGDAGTLSRVRQELYGTVPLLQQGDARLFKDGERATWTGIANPFGYTAGQVVPMELAHVAWYYGSKGVVPVNTMTIKNHPVLTYRWLSTFDRFGPNGTDAPTWGKLPNEANSEEESGAGRGHLPQPNDYFH